MKIFQNMDLFEALQLYNKVKESQIESNFKKILLNDIYFFTAGLSKNYE